MAESSFHPADEGPLDPVWSPARYPSFTPDQRGSWRTVLDGKQPIGVMWTNHVGGTGVLWAQQTDAIEKLRKHFNQYARNDVPGEVAYNNAVNIGAVTFGDEQNGVLQGVFDEMDAIMDDFD